LKENFLHYVWKYKLFDKLNLKLSDNTTVQVIDFGQQNYNAGPDFFNGKVRIGDTLWVGNIEIHVNSSDWYKHKHQNDKAYNNVILHVVFLNDKPVIDLHGNKIPTLELSSLISNELIHNYENLVQSKLWIPCENQIINVDEFSINSWLNRLAIERLERKSIAIKTRLKKTIQIGS
jgi:hypothetical protein